MFPIKVTRITSCPLEFERNICALFILRHSLFFKKNFFNINIVDLPQFILKTGNSLHTPGLNQYNYSLGYDLQGPTVLETEF